MKKILVTGAGGFFGSHLVERLIEYGYHVRAFIHYNSNNSYGWLRINFYPNIIQSLNILIFKTYFQSSKCLGITLTKGSK